ncbi:MAG: hypothetical protein D6781_07765 [Verrucomicrobia bacterium]|nr:MAG: hypothetical protein D6781_07765 [Verrucomicrobiota bacterium]
MNTDYILRLLEHLAAAITAIRSAREGGRLEEARREIASRCLEQTGLPLELVLHLPVDHLEVLLAASGHLRVQRTLWLGELLAEHGDLDLRFGNPPAAAMAFARSRRLLDSILADLGADEQTHVSRRLHELSIRLGDFDPAPLEEPPA